MPTIHREAGFRFSFFANDHNPPHIHVTNSNGTMKVILGDQTMAPSIFAVTGMKKADGRKALKIIQAHKNKFLSEWSKWHA